MVDPFTGILIFVAITAVTGVVFGGWLLFTAGRGVLRLMGYDPSQPGAARPDAGAVRCPRDRCGAMNPSTARFCRRCGQPLRLR